MDTILRGQLNLLIGITLGAIAGGVIGGLFPSLLSQNYWAYPIEGVLLGFLVAGIVNWRLSR